MDSRLLPLYLYHYSRLSEFSRDNATTNGQRDPFLVRWEAIHQAFVNTIEALDRDLAKEKIGRA